MRLKPQDLSIHLQKGLAPLYFVVGEEPQQKLDVLQQIRESAQQRGYGPRERYDITPQFDWEHFQIQLGELSLFSQKRFIEGRLTGNIGKLGARVLVEIANNPQADTLLLLSSDKLESSVAKSAWFTAIERSAITLWTRPLAKSELLLWIKKRSQEQNLHLNEAAMLLLAERTEGNLLATEQTLVKLGLYTGVTPHRDNINNTNTQETPTTITPAIIAAITGVDTQFSLFEWVDTLLLGDMIRTKQIFIRLRSEGVEPILMLWALTREVRAVIPVAKSIQKGLALAQGLREHNLWKHKLPLYTAVLNRHSLSSLYSLLIQARGIDHLIKGRESGDVWFALWVLCLNLAGTANV